MKKGKRKRGSNEKKKCREKNANEKKWKIKNEKEDGGRRKMVRRKGWEGRENGE